MEKIHYYSVNKYLKDTFGEKVYKLALDGGFTCPNRDGTLDTRGCIFCSGMGSGEFAERINNFSDISKQIELGKQRINAKTGMNCKYIAYFQSFTNTYAPVERLRELYMAAISNPDIVAISIATRPDCLPDDVLLLLRELNQLKPVWVELGLQTIHPNTAKYIRRGYELNVYDDAVRKLNSIGISQIITHIILGLPGETKDMMLDSVRYVVDSGTGGIKLQLLHVIKGTDLEKEYIANNFDTLTLEEYVDIVVSCVDIIPNNVVIHRITGDGDKKTLVSPQWSANKKLVLNTLNIYIQC